MGVEYLGNGNPSGTSLGKATTEKISFFGVTPVVQQTGAASSSTTAQTTALVNAIRTALVNLGLITDV